MDSKNLSIDTPMVFTYTKTAMLTAILGAQESTKAWVYYNFWQLFGHLVPYKPEFFVDLGSYISPQFVNEWSACPCIKSYLVDRNTPKKEFKTFCDFAISEIDKNHYLYYIINKKYISEYKLTMDKPHNIFINGYDLDRKIFTCFDFFQYKYEKREIPFAEIEESFDQLTHEVLGFEFFYDIYLLEVVPPMIYPFIYPQDTETIIPSSYFLNCLKSILSPKDQAVYELINRRKDNGAFIGLDVYDGLVSHILSEKAPVKNVRPFFAIKDHLTLIASGVEYFKLSKSGNKKVILEKIESICGLAQKIGVYIDMGRD